MVPFLTISAALHRSEGLNRRTGSGRVRRLRIPGGGFVSINNDVGL